MSELTNLWKKQRQLSKRIDYGVCKITPMDYLLLPIYKRLLIRVNYQINHFDKKRDEYDWEILK